MHGRIWEQIRVSTDCTVGFAGDSELNSYGPVRSDKTYIEVEEVDSGAAAESTLLVLLHQRLVPFQLDVYVGCPNFARKQHRSTE